MARRPVAVWAGILLAGFLLVACGSKKSNGPPPSAVEPVTRPENWAVKLKGVGVSNFHRITKNFYRGAQPSARGMRFLESMGIKTVINLRWLHSDRDELKGTSLKYIHIKFNTISPKTRQVVRFLKAVTDPNNQPVFLHCKHGADRTGMMTAFYRITVQGWSKKEAIREMTKGGYNFHRIWKHLLKFIRRADIEKIRTAAGIVRPGGPPARPVPSPAKPLGAMAPQPAQPAR
jgi:protein tyrosine phosphatase (PTP) superfamily phosphohydrolase (DUF442 family)